MRLQREKSVTLIAATLVLALAGIGLTSHCRAAFINLTPDPGFPNSVDFVPLDDLVNGAVDGVIVGDKTFTGFSYSRIGDMPQASDVNVLGFQDTSGNWGISFHGTFLDLPGGGPSDALIRFMVEVSAAKAAQGWRITDAHLAIGGAGAGGPNSLFLVDETLSNGELLEAYVSTLGGQQQQDLEDDAIFAPVLKLNVTKDILAIAAAGNFLPARATVIDQSFSQQIPEPAAALLSLIGVFAVAGVCRNRLKRRDI